jgi:hypothetical protein
LAAIFFVPHFAHSTHQFLPKNPRVPTFPPKKHPSKQKNPYLCPNYINPTFSQIIKFVTKKIKILLFLTVATTSAAFAQAPDGYDDGIYHKWEIKIDAAPSIASRGDQNEGYGLTDYDESIGADLGVGYNFTSNWYAGLSSGFWFHWGGETNKMIPVLADVVWRWNLGTSERFSLFLQGRTGYLFGLEKDRDYFKGLPDYRFSDHFYADIQPGIYIRTGRNVDFRVSLGYGYTHPIHNYEQKYFDAMTEEQREEFGKDYYYAQPEHIVTLKLGFNFRGKPTTPSRNFKLEDEIEELEVKARIERQVADRAQYRADRATERLAKNDEQFERQVEKTRQREADMVLYYVIPDADDVPTLDTDLQLLAEWAKSHKKGRIVLKAYIANTRSALSYASDARKRIKHVKDILVNTYHIKSRVIKSDIYVVSDKTARENNISRRVDIFKQLHK